MYVRYPLSLRNVEDLLAERGIDISYETVRFWWNRFGSMFAAEIRKRRAAHMRGYPQWRSHLDEVFVKVNGKLCYLWRAVDHEGEPDRFVKFEARGTLGNYVSSARQGGGGSSPQEPVCGGQSFRIMPTLLQIMFFWGSKTAAFCAFHSA